MFSSCCGCANKKPKEKITENSDNKHENLIVDTNDEKDNSNENKDCVTSVNGTGNNKEEDAINDVEATNDVNGKLENGSFLFALSLFYFLIYDCIFDFEALYFTRNFSIWLLWR